MDWSAGKIFLYARSPVAPRNTRASDGMWSTTVFPLSRVCVRCAQPFLCRGPGSPARAGNHHETHSHSSQPYPCRKIFEQLCISAANHNIVRFQRRLEPGYDIHHTAPPPFLAQPLQTAQSDVILISAPILVEEVGQFHGLEDAVYNECRTQPGAQTEKQHAPSFIAPNGLHGGVVHQLNGTAKRLCEVEANPPAA